MSDNELVVATRDGDRSAYAELWRRHSRAAITVARSYTSFDADDVVAEAFANIYTAIGKGGGPTAGFRPYLFTTVRNVAAQWGRAANSHNVEDIESIGDISNEADTLDRLEKTLTAAAFRSLPEKWQEVLWYSEVEAMTPRQIAPLLGMSPNAVSALTLRAREGLRVAWIKTHLSSTNTDPECTWTLGKLAAWSRGTVSPRLKTRIDAHLESCANCKAVADEAMNVNSRLALILLPLAAGVAGASAYLSSRGAASQLPVAMSAGSGVSASGAGMAVVGGLVAAVIVAATWISFPASSGTALAETKPLYAPQSAPSSIETAAPTTPQVSGPVSSPLAGPTPSPTSVTSPTDAGEGPDLTVGAPASVSVVETVDATLPPVDVPAASLNAPSITSSERPVIVYPAVHGTATPHATVEVAVQGVADGWTVLADSAGEWEAELSGLTPGVWTVTAAQTVADASGTRQSEPSPSATVELVAAPRAVNEDTSATRRDGALSGLPNASYAYTLVLTNGRVSSGTLKLDAAGQGSVPLPRDDDIESISVSYVFGDWVGPTRVIRPPVR